MPNAWISDRLRSLKKTKSGLARALGIDPARVSEIIGGRRNVQLAELPRMAEILEMPTAQLVELLTPRNGMTPRFQLEEPAADASGFSYPDGLAAPPADPQAPPAGFRNLPVYGSVPADPDGAIEMNGAAVDFAERPPSLAGARNAYAVYVQDETMSPRFEPGWLLHVNPSRPVLRGDNVVVQIRGSGRVQCHAHIRLFEERTADRLLVRQFDPPFFSEWPLDQVVAVHRIVGVAEM